MKVSIATAILLLTAGTACGSVVGEPDDHDPDFSHWKPKVFHHWPEGKHHISLRRWSDTACQDVKVTWTTHWRTDALDNNDCHNYGDNDAFYALTWLLPESGKMRDCHVAVYRGNDCKGDLLKTFSDQDAEYCNVIGGEGAHSVFVKCDTVL